MSAKILLVEDNPKIMEMNRQALTMHGYRVFEAQTLEAGRILFEEEAPDLIILDIMLPDGDGRLLCEELRKGIRRVPILFASGLKADEEIESGYDSGGDGYLPKPYGINVLIKSVRALLELSGYVPEVVTKGALTLNVDSNQAFVNDKDIGLSPNYEFSLLNIFFRNENKLLDPEYLYKAAWGQPLTGDTQALKSVVKRLRNKLKGSGFTITTERGNGFIFEKGEAE